jgi:hypothetical protein
MKRTDLARAHSGAIAPRNRLSKSGYLSGLQCPKLLWFQRNRADLFPAPDDATCAAFDEGREVGELARRLFPGGIFATARPANAEICGARTNGAPRTRQTLFEPACTFQNAYARADILIPVEGEQWDLTEVKATTNVEDAHIQDLAFQAHVFAASGVKLRRSLLMHLNGDYVKRGSIDPNNLFVAEDVTDAVVEECRDVPERVDELQSVIRSQGPPAVDIGRHCDHPHECPLKSLCWAFLPEHNVTELYRGKRKAFALLADGISRIVDIPSPVSLSPLQTVQRRAINEGCCQVHQAALVRFLAKLKYPVHFLDFETYQTAIPRHDGTRPYQQIPFQFSLHLQRAPGAPVEHRAWLADGAEDPRREFLRNLHAAVETEGSLVVYNAAFEKRVLREGAEAFPENAGWIKDATGRIVDLLEPFRSFHFYAPDQHGSVSLKAVLPALTGRGYAGLQIQNGTIASLAFMRIAFTNVADQERRRIRRHLEDYCGLDTSGMVEIVEALRRLVAGGVT